MINTIMKNTWNELNEVYLAGLTRHRIFWDELDRISWRDTVAVARKLMSTRLVSGADWVQLCSMVDWDRQHPNWNWTMKQIRWMKMLVVSHYHDLEVLMEM